MKHSGIQNSLWAMTMLLSISGWPLLHADREPLGVFQNPQQDPNKQQQGQPASKDSSTNPPSTKPADSKNTGDKPTPLFGGTLNVKSSRQTKDTATLGFNGVDDNGKVQKSFLSAQASGADTSAVQKLAAVTLSPTELDDFIKQGALNSNPAPKKSSNPGDKP
jgi:hypothetical protein